MPGSPLDARLRGDLWMIADATMRAVLDDHAVVDVDLCCAVCGHPRPTAASPPCRSFATAREALSRRLEWRIGSDAARWRPQWPPTDLIGSPQAARTSAGRSDGVLVDRCRGAISGAAR